VLGVHVLTLKGESKVPRKKEPGALNADLNSSPKSWRQARKMGEKVTTTNCTWNGVTRVETRLQSSQKKEVLAGESGETRQNKEGGVGSRPTIDRARKEGGTKRSSSS